MKEWSSERSNTKDTFQSLWYRLFLVFMAIEIIVFWFFLGPNNPFYAVIVVAGTFALGPAIAEQVSQKVPSYWFKVPKNERFVHRILGIGAFAWCLEVSGWNRIVARPLRGFSGQRSDLATLQHGLETSFSAHGFCFLIHLALAIAAAYSVEPLKAVFCMLMPGVLVHLYPAILQRSVMLRLQPIAQRSRA